MFEWLRKRTDVIAKILFFAAAAALIWAWGVMSVIRLMFPYPQLRDIVSQSRAAMSFLLQEANIELPIYYTESSYEPAENGSEDPASETRLVLVSHMIADGGEVVRIIDEDKSTLHEWAIDWFELWPEPTHLSESEAPKTRPGTSIHGLKLMPDGSLVFNFENLGLLRLDFCGEVKWRLPYRTHHSVEVDGASGNLWVSGKRVHTTPSPELPNHVPPFEEATVLEVSPDGEILSELSVPELLIDNGLAGLLYLSTRNNYGTRVSGDTLHLNDVEPFPETMPPGVFGPGDVMLSLRNINGIIVFDRKTLEVSFASIGQVLRQHDPDFIDGNRISIFDNNNLSPVSNIAPLNPDAARSRIVILDARTRETEVVYQSDDPPFFTDIMGKHQWLENGHIMITAARMGRSFEIDREREIVWEYVNRVNDELVALIDDTQRLPASFNRSRLAELQLTCPATVLTQASDNG